MILLEDEFSLVGVPDSSSPQAALSLVNNNNHGMYVSLKINKALHKGKNYLTAERRFGYSLKLREVIVQIRFRESPFSIRFIHWWGL